MRKNPFIKSMMRQPARTALLAGLILLAAFAFSLRVVEYVIVRGQIYEIARYYRAIGHVSHPYRFGDISDAAEIIASDSRVDFIDRRRSVEGVLADVQNANFSGMARRGITFPTMRQRESSITEAYFYGELQTKIIRGNRIELHVLVDGVLAGHPEYIAPGQTVILRQHFENSNPGALDGISEGGRYFFRAAYFRIYPAWGDVIGPRLPRVGYLGDVLAIMPLNPQSDFAERIMFLPANALDFENPLFAHIPAEIEMLNRDHRAMSIQTTRDMTALPHIDQIFELLYGGRIIDKTDYLAGNRVAMIDATFARDRGFGVGDTLILDVPRSQHYAGEIGIAGFTAPLHRAARDHAEHHDNYYTLELEIVGITRLHPRNFTLDTRQSFFVWIPDSALPNDIETAGLGEMPDALFSFSIGDSRDNEAFYAEFSELLADMGYMLHMDFPDSLNFWATAEPVLVIIFFNAVLFVIVLLAVLSLVTFLYKKQRHKEFAVMRALGTPARVILARILASVFLVALVPSFAGAFAGWYVALNRSESTLLGFEDAYLDAIPPDGLLLFWNNLMGEGATIPAGLTVSIRTVDIAADLGAIWAVGLGAITFGIFFLMIAYAGISLLRLPVLMLLQGRAVKVRPPKIAVKDGSDAPPVQVFAKTPFPTKTLKRDTRLIWRNSLVYIRRHIVRVPIQSGLRLFVAMFFVFALGWISESILQTNREIDRLYDTTIVWGEIIHCPIFLAELEMANIGRPPLDTYNPDWLVIRPGWDIYGVRMESDSWISRGRIRRVMETGMVEETYRESIFVHSFTIAPDEFGSLPWNWRVQVGYFRHMRTTFDINPTAINQLLAFNDYNTFTSRHSGFDINWAPGFDSSIFDYQHDFDPFISRAHRLANPDTPIPIIISETVAEIRGLDLGDSAIVSYKIVNTMDHFYAIVAGIHNEQINLPQMQQSTIISQCAYRAFVHFFGQYSTFAFSINTDYNREINSVREIFYQRFFTGAAVATTTYVNIYDSELISVVSSMEQSLLLLELLYPIAIAVSIAIGGGLSMLILLQNARNAAIMRSLGASPRRTRIIILAEQLLIVIAGLIAAIIILATIGFAITTVIMLSALYLLGVTIGSTIGTFMVTNKSPLDMLTAAE